ncbi:hypothetical protein EP56_01700 [Listeriaceae bacterium FSL A5-0209]|nr:hypothetical protein EP56_01700 [Listeriaceae bacterium FSL A5-0209]
MKDWRRFGIKTLVYLVLATMIVLGVACYRENVATFYAYLVSHGFADTTFLGTMQMLPSSLSPFILVYALFVFYIYLVSKTKTESLLCLAYRAAFQTMALLAVLGCVQWSLFQFTHVTPTREIQWLVVVMYSLMVLTLLSMVIYNRKALLASSQAFIRQLSQILKKKDATQTSEDAPLFLAHASKSMLPEQRTGLSNQLDGTMKIARAVLPSVSSKPQVPESLQAYIQNQAGNFSGNALIRKGSWLDVQEIMTDYYSDANKIAYLLGDQLESLTNMLRMASQLPEKEVDLFIPFELSTFRTYKEACYLLHFISDQQPKNVRFIFIQTLYNYEESAVNKDLFNQFVLQHFTYHVLQKDEVIAVSEETRAMLLKAMT